MRHATDQVLFNGLEWRRRDTEVQAQLVPVDGARGDNHDCRDDDDVQRNGDAVPGHTRATSKQNRGGQLR